MTPAKLFIVGCPRTGKTLLSKVLNASQKICIAEETQYLRKVSLIGKQQRRKRFGDLSVDQNLIKFTDWLFEDFDAPYWIWLRSNLTREEFIDRIFNVDRNDQSIFTLLMQLYAEHNVDGNIDELIQGEETPTHIYSVANLLEWYPDSKIIHMIRDPRDIIISQLEQVKIYGGITNLLDPIPQGLLKPLVTPLEVLYLTKLWKDAVNLHHKYTKKYSDHYVLLKFEEMIENPVDWLYHLGEIINIKIENEMLSQIEDISAQIKNALLSEQKLKNPYVDSWFNISCKSKLMELGYL
jgi:hypothetical protein